MTKTQLTHLYVLIGSAIVALLLIAPTFSPESFPRWWPSQKIRLGLDLRGGSYLVLSVQTEEAVKSQLLSIGQTIKSELSKDRIGITRVRTSGDRSLEVTLLSDRGVQRLDSYVRQSFPELLKGDQTTDGGRVTLTYSFPEPRAREIERLAVDQAIETVRNRVDAFGLAEPTIQRTGEKGILVQLPDVTNIESVKTTIGSVAKLEFRLVDAGAKGMNAETRQLRSKEGGNVTVEDEILMTGDTISNARIEFDPHTAQVQVLVEFNSVGAQLFDRITTENVGRQLAIVLDGVVQSAPRIEERIGGGHAQIHGNFTTEEAHRLAIVLRSGALPAPLQFEEQRTVGASLGADSIRKGLLATAVGCALVIVFMSFYYRRAGQIAVVCLLLNLLWLVALLATFGATLTLPGIAGLALTIGMAVDANVLIFERIREELKRGVNAAAAITAGFDRAHWTIMDANLTTLLSGVILYCFGTGPIKGFAVTLSLGILTTLAAALYASRELINIVPLKDSQGRLSI